MKPTFIYLHGFASHSAGAKRDSLINSFSGKVNILTPNMDIDPTKIEAQIEDVIAPYKNSHLVFIGTSLGGFWAAYFANKYNTHSVVVNPATRPSEVLANKLNMVCHNYKTGEPITVLPEYISQYAMLEKKLAANYTRNTINMFLAVDDDELDYMQAVQDWKYLNSQTIIKSGGHRFTNHWPLVLELLNRLYI